jgi:hypothetical protein
MTAVMKTTQMMLIPSLSSITRSSHEPSSIRFARFYGLKLAAKLAQSGRM